MGIRARCTYRPTEEASTSTEEEACVPINTEAYREGARGQTRRNLACRRRGSFCRPAGQLRWRGINQHGRRFPLVHYISLDHETKVRLSGCRPGSRTTAPKPRLMCASTLGTLSRPAEATSASVTDALAIGARVTVAKRIHMAHLRRSLSGYQQAHHVFRPVHITRQPRPSRRSISATEDGGGRYLAQQNMIFTYYLFCRG